MEMVFTECNNPRSDWIFCQKNQSNTNLKFSTFFVLFNVFFIVLYFEDVNFIIEELDSNRAISKNCFLCNQSNIYMNRAYLCENSLHCSISNFDENILKFCQIEKTNRFTCKKSKKKINFFQVCDYVSDCEDNSDEEICGIFFLFFFFIQ